ncbi:MAG: UDP-N-acetylmuramate dehydrogenase [Sedimentisphaerales bacterium]|nr:UDP-N-acetylmuramate dehydrogenase [Sedimentisphaerales bacterium]
MEDIVRQDVPLSEHTWFKLGGPARYFVEPRNEEELLDVVQRCHESGIEMYVLGRGSNLLVADEGIDGVVIRLSHDEFSKIEFEGEVVRARSGADLSFVIRECARNGLSGMECLAGIPGTIGGAVKINAGGRFGDIGNVAQSVKLMDSSGYRFERKRHDIFFGYRMTNIMAKFILEAEFSLVPDDPDQIGKMIKEVWMLKKNTQPMKSRNAGCIFKNPRALSAGALIDKAGLKGTNVGGARISRTHANFIIAEDGSTATDVLKLIELVRERVRQRFDVELELEVEIWQ